MRFEANEGMWLTQKKELPIEQRVLTKAVETSQKMFEKNWHEITDAKKQEYDAEYAAWLAEQEQESGTDDGLGY